MQAAGLCKTNRQTYEMSSSRSVELTSSALAIAATPSLLKPLFEMLNVFSIWLLYIVQWSRNTYVSVICHTYVHAYNNYVSVRTRFDQTFGIITSLVTFEG